MRGKHHLAELTHRLDQVRRDLPGVVVAVEAVARLRKQLAEEAAEEMVETGRRTNDRGRRGPPALVFGLWSFVSAVCGHPRPQSLIAPAEQEGDPLLHRRLDLDERQ